MKHRIAVNLRDQRLRVEMSQETLARILRVSPSTVAAWEAGTVEPDREQLAKISQALGIRIEDLTADESNHASADAASPSPHENVEYASFCTSPQGSSPLRGMTEPGEMVLWEGQPIYKRSRDSVFRIFFGIIFLLFSVIWTVSAGSFAGMPFALFGLPFIAVGIWILFGIGYRMRHAYASTYYMLTDRRILLYCGSRRPILSQVMLADIRSVDSIIYDNEIATLVPITAYASSPFGASPYARSPYRRNTVTYSPTYTPAAYLTHALVNIHDYTQVRSLIMSRMGDGKTT